MQFTIAVITDLHYGERLTEPDRRGEWACRLAERMVQRLRGGPGADAAAVLGDCIDGDGDGCGLRRLAELGEVLDGLPCPWFAIPGNHDPDPHRFYSIFPRPADVATVGNVRFVAFIDPEEPEWNARRTAQDIDRLRHCRGTHRGPVVTLQHVPVLPPGTTGCPYRYTNLDEVMTATREARVTLSVSGHYHAGTPVVSSDGTAFVSVPAVCEPPFPFALLHLDADAARGDVRMDLISLAP